MFICYWFRIIITKCSFWWYKIWLTDKFLHSQPRINLKIIILLKKQKQNKTKTFIPLWLPCFSLLNYSFHDLIWNSFLRISKQTKIDSVDSTAKATAAAATAVTTSFFLNISRIRCESSISINLFGLSLIKLVIGAKEIFLLIM